MKFIEKVGNIKVYTEEHGSDLKVVFINGCDIVLEDLYPLNAPEKAIENLFQKFDTYSEEYLYLFLNDLEKVTENLYKSNGDWFKRIDNTRFFKHFDHKPMI